MWSFGDEENGVETEINMEIPQTIVNKGMTAHMGNYQ